MSYIFLLFFSVQLFANNGEFITPNHEWFENSKAVVPIYYDAENYEKDLQKVTPQKPQAICTGTLLNEGKNLLSAAHCFQKTCPSKKEKMKAKYFFLLGDKKIFFEKINLQPEYCFLAYELDYKKKVDLFPLFPELNKDIALAQVSSDQVSEVQKQISFFPNLNFTSPNLEKDTFYTVGYGVSDRFLIYNTLWIDDDKDNVHDSWDLCPETQRKLLTDNDKFKTEFMLSTNGCDKDQTPSAKALDYFTATKISHKRGFSFKHAFDKDFIFEQYRVLPEPFLVNHGYRGSFPFNNLQPLSFGGDSGSPVFSDANLKSINALTIWYSGIQAFAIKKILKAKGKLTPLERREILSGGFNAYLLIKDHEEFLKSHLVE